MASADIHRQVDALTTTFIDGLVALARKVAQETLVSALDSGLPSGKAAKVSNVLGARARGEKRSRAEIAALRDQLREFVRANPGLRIEQINKELGTTTRDTFRPLHQLIAEGAVYTKGARRATTYYPKGKASTKKAAPAKKASSRKPKAKKATPKAAPKAAKKRSAKPSAKKEPTPKKMAAPKSGAPTQKDAPKSDIVTEADLRAALEKSKGSARGAAKLLNRPPSTIRDAMKRYGIKADKSAPASA